MSNKMDCRAGTLPGKRGITRASALVPPRGRLPLFPHEGVCPCSPTRASALVPPRGRLPLFPHEGVCPCSLHEGVCPCSLHEGEALV